MVALAFAHSRIDFSCLPSQQIELWSHLFRPGLFPCQFTNFWTFPHMSHTSGSGFPRALLL